MSCDYFVRCFQCGENASGDNLRYPPALFRVVALALEIANCPGAVERANDIFTQDGTTAGFAGPGGDSIAPFAWLLEHAPHDLGVVDEYGDRVVDEQGTFADVVLRFDARIARLEREIGTVARQRDYYVKEKGP